jgi:hypothetical protein
MKQALSIYCYTVLVILILNSFSYYFTKNNKYSTKKEIKKAARTFILSPLYPIMVIIATIGAFKDAFSKEE